MGITQSKPYHERLILFPQNDLQLHSAQPDSMLSGMTCYGEAQGLHMLRKTGGLSVHYTIENNSLQHPLLFQQLQKYLIGFSNGVQVFFQHEHLLVWLEFTISLVHCIGGYSQVSILDMLNKTLHIGISEGGTKLTSCVRLFCFMMCFVTPNNFFFNLVCLTGGVHTLATHILQFVYLGHTGFKWPVAYYTTTEAQATELMVLVWRVINTLSTYGFEVWYSRWQLFSHDKYCKMRKIIFSWWCLEISWSFIIGVLSKTF